VECFPNCRSHSCLPGFWLDASIPLHRKFRCRPLYLYVDPTPALVCLRRSERAYSDCGGASDVVFPGYILTAKFLQRVVQRRQACIRRLSEHKLTTRPDSTSGEPRFEPPPFVVRQRRSVSVQRPHRRYRRYCCRFRQARHTIGRMKRPKYPRRSAGNVTWK